MQVQGGYRKAKSEVQGGVRGLGQVGKPQHGASLEVHPHRSKSTWQHGECRKEARNGAAMKTQSTRCPDRGCRGSPERMCCARIKPDGIIGQSSIAEAKHDCPKLLGMKSKMAERAPVGNWAGQCWWPKIQGQCAKGQELDGQRK